MTNPYGANTDPHEQSGDFDEGRKVTNIRVGDHADQHFDRVVFDLSGGGTPGWYAAYTDSATQEGSGAEVDVPGQAIITVSLRGINWTEENLPEYDGAPVDGPGGSIVAVRWGGSFEGTTQVFVGTTGRLPFRVAVATDPNRVYIDVAQSGA
jgi:hypothetical protein